MTIRYTMPETKVQYSLYSSGPKLQIVNGRSHVFLQKTDRDAAIHKKTPSSISLQAGGLAGKLF